MRFRLQKAITLAVLTILLTADVVLAVYATRWSGGFPKNELAAQKAEAKLLKADIQRALAIQKGMPQTKADCERFENSLLSSNTGYSALTDEMSEVAKHSGLQIASLGFHHKELPGRNIVELELDATVNGNYKSVVQFLNGLQRSKNHYVVDSLTLASEPGSRDASGTLRVALQLKSYFKNAP